MAQREAKAADPVWDGVCFHTQQCAEKYLKAFLEEHNIPFPKIHDLVVLFNLSGGLLSDLDPVKTQLTSLNAFSVAARYPGEWADQQDAEEATEVAEKVRTVVRAKLGLP